MKKTAEDLLIDKIKELQLEFKENKYMTELILKYEIEKYFKNVYLKS
ncbi:hypothetical protein FH136_10180 [Staphylococcus hominis]|nr:hypothetical protein [Staphylococcus hominis]MCI2923939.1 hypothetical protein [Staphylococcus hominis]MDS3912851.1 hypothetical protein [Staphylococcus hominis]